MIDKGERTIIYSSQSKDVTESRLITDKISTSEVGAMQLEEDGEVLNDDNASINNFT